MRVVVNAAMSADGKLASRRREQVRISGREDFDRVDELRANVDAVMVGVGTVLADDPSLTVKDTGRVADREARSDPAHPARVVADSHARTPPEAAVLSDDADTYVLVCAAEPEDHREALRAAGAEVVVAGDSRVNLPAALDELEARGVESLLVEGGGEVIFSLFDAGLVDELHTFVGPKIIGGRDAPTLADGEGFGDPAAFAELELEGVERYDDGVLLSYDVR
jgi:2,5-diamino-6-(ribosylamino)-4(3H)-pyrimidinone 5'-phosphate reductase